jgi:hypothetical protein
MAEVTGGRFGPMSTFAPIIGYERKVLTWASQRLATPPVPAPSFRFTNIAKFSSHSQPWTERDNDDELTR